MKQGMMVVLVLMVSALGFAEEKGPVGYFDKILKLANESESMSVFIDVLTQNSDSKVREFLFKNIRREKIKNIPPMRVKDNILIIGEGQKDIRVEIKNPLTAQYMINDKEITLNFKTSLKIQLERINQAILSKSVTWTWLLPHAEANPAVAAGVLILALAAAAASESAIIMTDCLLLSKPEETEKKISFYGNQGCLQYLKEHFAGMYYLMTHGDEDGNFFYSRPICHFSSMTLPVKGSMEGIAITFDKRRHEEKRYTVKVPVLNSEVGINSYVFDVIDGKIKSISYETMSLRKKQIPFQTVIDKAKEVGISDIEQEQLLMFPKELENIIKAASDCCEQETKQCKDYLKQINMYKNNPVNAMLGVPGKLLGTKANGNIATPKGKKVIQ